jgi:hypothetical protein
MWAGLGVGLIMTVVASAAYFATEQEAMPRPQPAHRATPVVSAALEPARMARIERAFGRAREALSREIAEVEAKLGKGAGAALVAARDRLAADLQAQLGPSDYDWMLYLHEIPNRVAVAAVPDDAPIAARLVPGDIFVSYAGQRVFTPDDLRRARLQVEPSAAIPARVVRGGAWVDLELPPGSLEALGVRFEQGREQPEASAPAPMMSSARGPGHAR